MTDRPALRYGARTLPPLVESTAKKLSTNPLQRRESGRLRLVYGLDAIENLGKIALRNLNIIVILQIEPKLCRCADCLGEPKRGIGGNASLFAGVPFVPRGREAGSRVHSTRRHH